MPSLQCNYVTGEFSPCFTNKHNKACPVLHLESICQNCHNANCIKSCQCDLTNRDSGVGALCNPSIHQQILSSFYTQLLLYTIFCTFIIIWPERILKSTHLQFSTICSPLSEFHICLIHPPIAGHSDRLVWKGQRTEWALLAHEEWRRYLVWQLYEEE